MFGSLCICAALFLASWPTAKQRSPGLLVQSPPPQAEFSSNYACLEIAAEGLRSVSVQGPLRTTLGVRSGAVFYVLNVPIEHGQNELLVSAVTKQGAQVAKRLLVFGKPNPKTPVLLKTLPEVSEGWPAKVAFSLQYSLPEKVIQLLVDSDGDGDFLAQAFTRSFEVIYDGGITAMPAVLLRTKSNLLYASNPQDQLGIRVVPPSTTNPSLRGVVPGASFIDLELRPERLGLLALDGAQQRVVVFTPSLAVETEVFLNPSVNPTGIAADALGNIYVVDNAGHRVVRLLANLGYLPDPTLGPDGAFGSEGSADGQLFKPTDVAVGEHNGTPRVFVADAGNSRIQVFDSAGGFALGFGLIGGSGAVRTITVSHGGSLYVPIPTENAIVEYTDRGTLLTSLKYSSPLRIAEDAWTSDIIVTADLGQAIELISSEGIVSRSVRTSLRPMATAPLVTETGHRLGVVDGSDTLYVVDLDDDAPSFRPVDTVTSFYSAVVARDWNTAQGLLDARAIVAFDALREDPQRLEQLESIAEAFTVAELVRLTPRTGEVRAALGVRDPSSARVSLARNPTSLRWEITSF